MRTYTIACAGTGYAYTKGELITELSTSSKKRASLVYGPGKTSSPSRVSSDPVLNWARRLDRLMSDWMDILTGRSVSSNVKNIVEECRAIYPVESTESFGINLIGWSRGAVTAVAAANLLTKIYGDKIKINLCLVDPVAGPGNNKKEYQNIPGTVKNLQVFYAQKERRQIFTPIDLNILDPKKTSVSRIDTTGNHWSAVDPAFSKASYSKSREAKLVWQLCIDFLKKHGTKIKEKNIQFPIPLSQDEVGLFNFSDVKLSNNQLLEALFLSRFHSKSAGKKRGVIYIEKNAVDRSNKKFNELFLDNYPNLHHYIETKNENRPKLSGELKKEIDQLLNPNDPAYFTAGVVCKKIEKNKTIHSDPVYQYFSEKIEDRKNTGLSKLPFHLQEKWNSSAKPLFLSKKISLLAMNHEKLVRENYPSHIKNIKTKKLSSEKRYYFMCNAIWSKHEGQWRAAAIEILKKYANEKSFTWRHHREFCQEMIDLLENASEDCDVVELFANKLEQYAKPKNQKGMFFNSTEFLLDKAKRLRGDPLGNNNSREKQKVSIGFSHS